MTAPEPVIFAPARGRVTEPVTKVGGLPVWLETPQWPLSRKKGVPMDFIGQFRVDWGAGERAALAYVFMTGDDASVDNTFEPEGGENAVVVQPGGRTPDFVEVRAEAEGPTLGADHLPAPGEPTPDGKVWQFLGGPGVDPVWLQGDETPGPGWALIAQLDATAMPFRVNFGGTGVGYGFLMPDGLEGRFLWQA